MNLSLLSFCLLFCSSCGYRWQSDSCLFSQGRTISVPFVQGDQTGDLTSALIQEIATTGPWRYVSENADLLLCVCLVRDHDENIGFRYDRGRKWNVKRSIVPAETRLLATVEIRCIAVATGAVVCGPVQVKGWYDFDHDFYSSPKGINIFSLGQLTDIESAREAALAPLYRVLARNIVDYLRNCP